MGMAMFQYDTKMRPSQAVFSTLELAQRRPQTRKTMSATIAYITTPSREEAMRIGRALLEERLAACINILDGMQSVYWWQGALEESRECVLLVKSTTERKDAITARVKALHGYEVPCIVFLPLEGGNPDYLAWIERESGDA
jgi:periplasmic divalent cation tolerance protein